MRKTAVFTIRGIGPSTHGNVRVQASHIGITMNAVVLSVVPRIIESYPEYMREAPLPAAIGKHTITSINEEHLRQLRNISAHTGVNVGDLFKVELARLNR